MLWFSQSGRKSRGSSVVEQTPETSGHFPAMEIANWVNSVEPFDKLRASPYFRRQYRANPSLKLQMQASSSRKRRLACRSFNEGRCRDYLAREYFPDRHRGGKRPAPVIALAVLRGDDIVQKLFLEERLVVSSILTRGTMIRPPSRVV